MLLVNMPVDICPCTCQASYTSARACVIWGKGAAFSGPHLLGVLASLNTVLMRPSWRRSKTIQNLPPALFLLMKSTEPWSDEVCTPCLQLCASCVVRGAV